MGSGVQTVWDEGACAKSHLLANPGGVLVPLPPRAKELAPQGETLLSRPGAEHPIPPRRAKCNTMLKQEVTP